jgi:Cu-Zn family superoxide dismutase
MHHAGDLGNIVVGSNGAGNKSVTTTEWKVGDVVGKTVVLHMNVDDLTTDPSGNSGTRIACGVIVAR